MEGGTYFPAMGAGAGSAAAFANEPSSGGGISAQNVQGQGTRKEIEERRTGCLKPLEVVLVGTLGSKVITFAESARDLSCSCFSKFCLDRLSGGWFRFGGLLHGRLISSTYHFVETEGSPCYQRLA